MLPQLSLFQQCPIQSQDVMQTWLHRIRQHALLVQKDFLALFHPKPNECVRFDLESCNFCVHIPLLSTHVTFHRSLRLTPWCFASTLVINIIVSQAIVHPKSHPHDKFLRNHSVNACAFTFIARASCWPSLWFSCCVCRQCSLPPLQRERKNGRFVHTDFQWSESAKKPGLHPVNEVVTIAEVMALFAQQQMDGCSNFVFPEDLWQRPFDYYIATTSCGPFQTLFSSARVGKVLSFGKYLIRPNVQHTRMLAWLCSVVNAWSPR